MKRLFIVFFFAAIAASARISSVQAATPGAPDPNVMSPQYWEFWNDDVQREIDERIER